jgi:hypothetical protein
VANGVCRIATAEDVARMDQGILSWGCGFNNNNNRQKEEEVRRSIKTERCYLRRVVLAIGAGSGCH